MGTILLQIRAEYFKVYSAGKRFELITKITQASKALLNIKKTASFMPLPLPQPDIREEITQGYSKPKGFSNPPVCFNGMF
ncbi:hypothetical protein [Acetobacter senegalensis]|uniref:hypothetical protein n=1 Tax=Acetobacter senegalensis TaxID=446692 RepID=UPI0026563476|nr:hypothetical protein [Acetobacter senegalensis]MDN7354078.1 hypothetical protein [Acetobacter senegalensis]